MMRLDRRLLACLLGLVLLVAACGAGGGDASTAGDAGGGPSFSDVGDLGDRVETGTPDLADVSDALDGDADVLPATPGFDPTRSYISSASVRVETDDVGETAQAAVSTVEAAGGALYAETSSYEGRAEATLTLKVPPEEFRRMLTELGRLGRVLSQTVTTDDVTERVIDLDSRVDTARRSVDRVRGFLDAAGVPADISAFERELAEREADLEVLLGQQRTLAQQVELATIVATFVAPADEPAELAASAEDDEEPLPGFLDGLQGGWTAFTSVSSVLLVIVGAVLPFVPLVLAALGVRRVALWWSARGRAPAAA